MFLEEQGFLRKDFDPSIYHWLEIHRGGQYVQIKITEENFILECAVNNKDIRRNRRGYEWPAIFWPDVIGLVISNRQIHDFFLFFLFFSLPAIHQFNATYQLPIQDSVWYWCSCRVLLIKGFCYAVNRWQLLNLIGRKQAKIDGRSKKKYNNSSTYLMMK